MSDQLPDYTTIMVDEGGGIRHGVKWRGKFDPIAVCDDARDAQKICNLLNGWPASVESWDWVDASASLPDDDIEVLVLTRSERIVPAVHCDGHWYPAHKPAGQRLASASITHWIHPMYPGSE